MKMKILKALSTALVIVMIMSSALFSAEAGITKVSGSISVASFMNRSDSTADECRFTFTAEGAGNWSGEAWTQIVTKSSPALRQPDAPVHGNRKFLGWYTEDGVRFTSWDNAFVSGVKSVTLTARYEESYFLSFVGANGLVIYTQEFGNGGIKYKDINFAAAETVYSGSSDEGVSGWFMDAALTVPASEKTVNGLQTDARIYAKTETGCWVRYNTNGGSLVPSDFYKPNAKTKAPAEPQRPGYAFAGWYASSDASGSVYSFGSPISGSVTLYAAWTPVGNTTYTVIHWLENPNDDGFSFEASETLNGKTDSMTNAAAKKFEGFTADAINQTAIAADGSTIVNVYYKRNVYSVKFYAYVSGSSGGSGSSGRGRGGVVGEIIGTIMGKGSGGSYSAGGWNEISNLTITAKYGADIADKWPSRIDSSYASMWGTTKGSTSGSSPYQTGIATMPLNGTSFYQTSGSGSYTLELRYYTETAAGQTGTATYKGKSYTLDHVDSFKSTSNLRTSAEDHYDINGYTYTGNVSDGTSFARQSNGVYAVTFYYNRNSYDIKFVNNGSVESTVTKAFGENVSGIFYTPSRPAGVSENCVFAGWYDNQQLAGEPAASTGEFAMPAMNMTFYACWKAEDRRVTVNADASTALGEITVPYGGSIPGETLAAYKAEILAKLGEDYSFVCWMRLKTNGTSEVFDAAQPISENITVYPYCTNNSGEITGCTVSYSESGSDSWSDVQRYAPNTEAKVSAPASTLYAQGDAVMYFDYWTDIGGAVYYPGSTVLVTKDILLTAHYTGTPDEAVLVYHKNDGSSITAVKPGVMNNEAVTVIECEWNVEGNEFVSWNTEADGTGENIAPGTKIRIDNTSDNNLYAIWQSGTYNVTYSYAGEAPENAPALPETAEYGFGSEITLAAKPELEGFIFIGWQSEDVTLNGEKFTMPGKDVRLYGSWADEDVNSLEITSASGSWVYDGKEHSLPEYSVVCGESIITAAAGEGTALPYGGTLIITSTATIDAAGETDNAFEYQLIGAEGLYSEVVVNNGTLTVAPAAQVVITANSNTWEYDAQRHSDEGYTVTFGDEVYTALSGEPITLSTGDVLIAYVHSSIRNVRESREGNNKITHVKFDAADNYTEVITVDGTLTLTPARLKITAPSMHKSKDGRKMAPKSFTVEGMMGDDRVISAEVTGELEEEGQCESNIDNAVLSCDVENYEITYEPGELSITDEETYEVDIAISYAGKAEGKPLEFGQDYTMRAVLSRFEGAKNVKFQWQYSAYGREWRNVDGGTGETLTIVVTTENYLNAYRVLVTCEEEE